MDNSQAITKDYVRNMTKASEKFLCPLSANQKYKLQFLTFRIRDMDKKKVLFEMRREADKDEELVFDDDLFQEEELAEFRTIRYNFSPEFLELQNVGTLLEFKVADDQNVANFMIIERHYFKDQLIENYEFSFPFCMKGSVNTWEKIYKFPEIEENLKQMMIDHPWQTQSDTFYFVGDELVMHNKAYYNYKEQLDLD